MLIIEFIKSWIGDGSNMKKIQSTCNLCALACNLDFYVENGKIDRVSPTVDYPVNKGFCCIKGLNLDKQQTKIKARKNPLLRDENGEMKEVSFKWRSSRRRINK